MNRSIPTAIAVKAVKQSMLTYNQLPRNGVSGFGNSSLKMEIKYQLNGSGGSWSGLSLWGRWIVVIEEVFVEVALIEIEVVRDNVTENSL